jgi:hypothetical protein
MAQQAWERLFSGVVWQPVGEPVSVSEVGTLAIAGGALQCVRLSDGRTCIVLDDAGPSWRLWRTVRDLAKYTRRA